MHTLESIKVYKQNTRSQQQEKSSKVKRLSEEEKDGWLMSGKSFQKQTEDKFSESEEAESPLSLVEGMEHRSDFLTLNKMDNVLMILNES